MGIAFKDSGSLRPPKIATLLGRAPGSHRNRQVTRATAKSGWLPAADNPYSETGAPEPDDELISLHCGDDCLVQVKPEGVEVAGRFAAGDSSNRDPPSPESLIVG